MLLLKNKNYFFLLLCGSAVFTASVFSDEQAIEELSFPADAALQNLDKVNQF